MIPYSDSWMPLACIAGLVAFAITVCSNTVAWAQPETDSQQSSSAAAKPREDALAAMEAARQRLESSESPSPDEVALLGRIYAHQQDTEALATWMATAPASAAQSAGYWFATGSHHAVQGNHAKAVKCFCESVLRDQTDGQAYFLIGQSLNKLNASAEASEAFKRAELIEKTQKLGAEMAENAARDNEQMSTLIDLLDQLHRPLEALSWRGVQLLYESANSSLSDAEAQQIFSEILRERSLRSKANEVWATEKFVLCGIDPSSFESGEASTAVSDTQP